MPSRLLRRRPGRSSPRPLVRRNWFRIVCWAVLYLFWFDTLATSAYHGGASRRSGPSREATSAAVAGAPEETLPALERTAAGAMTLHVSRNGLCPGAATPCFTSIQAAIDAATRGQRIVVYAGEYAERLRIAGKNSHSDATEADRIVIEADPSSEPGAVVLGPAGGRCARGHAVRIEGSRFVTLRGFVLRDAGGRGIVLRGRGRSNEAIHVERNRILSNGTRACSGGISILRGNARTLVANNLIYANGRQGIQIADQSGGPHFVVSNTIVGNGWDGVYVARAQAVHLLNNLIVGNGQDRQRRGARFGVRRRGTGDPATVRLAGNLICGHAAGELKGPLLDGTDTRNGTPTGSEGPGVIARPSCGILTRLFADRPGADGTLDTIDDDFRLAPSSPAVDAGIALVAALPGLPPGLLRADHARENARPHDGDGDGSADYDIGALENGGPVAPTPSPTASLAPTPSPTPTLAPPPPTPDPTPTPALTPSPAPSPAPTASPEPTALPTPSPTLPPAATATPLPVCEGCVPCDTGLPGICAAGKTVCDESGFGIPECRTTIEPRSEACGNQLDDDCDGQVDEGEFDGTPRDPPATGVFVQPLAGPLRFPSRFVYGLAQGDFDGDGRLDVAVTHQGNVPGVGDRGFVSVLRGKGDGTFEEPHDMMLPSSPTVVRGYGILARDFDRDGAIDLLVASVELKQVLWFRGRGDGSFAAPLATETGLPAGVVQTEDLDCDGILDLALVGERPARVAILRGRGDGTFAAPSFLDGFREYSRDLALADLDGVNGPDVVLGLGESAYAIATRLNDGTGSFGPVRESTTQVPNGIGGFESSQPAGLQVADFDQDGHADLVFSVWPTPFGCAGFMRGRGDGTFEPPPRMDADGIVGPDRLWLCAGRSYLGRWSTENVAPDLNGDGIPDVLFANFPENSDDNGIVLGLGRGDGSFEATRWIASPGTGEAWSAQNPVADGSIATAAVAGDFDGDCLLDVAVASSGYANGPRPGGVSVLLAKTPGVLHAPRTVRSQHGYSMDNGWPTFRGAAVGDIDGDGDDDFALGASNWPWTRNRSTFDLLESNGDGSFAPAREAFPRRADDLLVAPTNLQLLDLDGDGRLDFLWTDRQGGETASYLAAKYQEPDGSFTDLQVAASPQNRPPANLITGDFDGDGDPDAAIFTFKLSEAVIEIYSNPGTRSPFTYVQQLPVGPGPNFFNSVPSGMTAADFDGDGPLDLVTVDRRTGSYFRIVLYRGNGDGTFGAGESIEEVLEWGPAANDMAAADLDGDGALDLIFPAWDSPCLWTMRGNGDGSFAPRVCHPLRAFSGTSIALRDFDLDGTLDVVIGHSGGGLSLVRGRGDGTFSEAEALAVGSLNVVAVRPADFDTDGRPDLLVRVQANDTNHQIVLMNNAFGGPAPTPTPTLPPGVTPTPTFAITPSPTPSPSPSPRPTAVPPEGLASIVVEPMGQLLLVSETQAYTATGILSDGTSVDLTSGVAWSSSAPAVASVNGAGLARGVAAGEALVTAAIGTFSGAAPLRVVARAVDFAEPVAQIDSPSIGAEVTAPIDIVGTASDPNFFKYELELAPAGESEFSLLVRGEAPVESGVLGQLDPTLLLNDLYTLRLTVFDRGGNQASASVTVQVSRDMKVGPFTLAYDDLTVPASGLPLRVVRAYDSRDKRRGDFGIGWRLDLQTIRIRSNRVLGTGWVRVVSGALVRLEATDLHRVSVVLPDGRVEEFDLQLSPTSQIGSLDATMVVGFAPRPGTRGTLEALANPNLLVLAGSAEDELVDDLTLRTYDPQLYRYTGIDGTRIELDVKLGVRKITDANGNELVLGPGGLVHSSGKAISFVRDAAGRIVQITDPMGRTQHYAYDARGDLVSHTDPLGNVTTFAYDRRHNLIRIVDPLARPVARNEYDDAGRLVAVTDAQGNRITLTHDIPGRQEVITDRLGRAEVLTYDDQGNILSSTNALGETTSYTYDGRGNPLSVTDPLGRTTTYTYDANDRPTSATDPLGHTVSATYDAAGRPLSATDALGHTTSFTYDAAGNLVSMSDPLGRTQSFTNDAAGNVLSLAGPGGLLVAREYDPSGLATKLTDELGRVIVFAYDANGNLNSQVDDTGFAQTLAYDASDRPVSINVGGSPRAVVYDAAGQITQVSTATGATASLQYDALGRITQMQEPGGGIALTKEYDAEDNLIAATDRLGNRTSYEYDAADRLVRTIFPDGSTELRSYDAAGQLKTVTDRRGFTTSFAYDAAGRLVEIRDALGNTTIRAYDAAGQVIAETDPLSRTTSFAYDALGQLVTTTFPDGTTEQRSYDAAGNLATRIDAAGHTTSYTYDARNRLLSVTDPLGAVTHYEHDDGARKSARIDANGNRTNFEYDLAGRLVRTIYPGGAAESTTYDGAGRPIHRTNGNGETIHYSYDGLGRLAAISLPGGEQETYDYAPDRLVTEVTDARGTMSFDYDPATRALLRVTESDGRTVRYAYDAAGNRIEMAHAAGAGGPEEVTSYSYDALGRLASVTDPSGGITRYEYDAAGNLVTTVLPNGVRIEQSFDLRDRLVAIVHRGPGALILASFAYTLDPLGNRTAVEYADGSRVEYDYDASSRLTAERHYDSFGVLREDATYSYDAVGNIVSRAGSLGSASFTYDARNQLQAGDGVSYAYDDAGNLISATAGADVTRFAYDARDRMIEWQPPSGSPTAYEYDFLGLRQRKSGPAGTTDYLVDRSSPTGFAQVVRESDSGGAVLRSYVHGRSLLARLEGGTASYYLADGLGSTRLLTDSTAAVTDTFDYTAYGSLLARTGSAFEPYGFAGEQLDTESGLIYLRARYYDPEIGRFLARDPAPGDESRPLSLHKYLYANANPVNFTDPSGLETLMSLQVSQGIQAEQRRTRLQKAVRAVRQLTQFAGRAYQYLGAVFSTIAVVESMQDKRPLRKFFANIPLGAPVSWTTAAVFPYIGARLGALSLGMFSKQAVYETESALVGGRIYLCKIGEYALAIRSPVRGNIAGTIVLCPNLVRSPPLPTSWDSVFGGFKGASGMGIMVHEWSHLILAAIDDEYLCSRAAALPANRQVKNADNYRCLVESYAILAAKDLVESALGP